MGVQLPPDELQVLGSELPKFIMKLLFISAWRGVLVVQVEAKVEALSEIIPGSTSAAPGACDVEDDEEMEEIRARNFFFSLVFQ